MELTKKIGTFGEEARLEKVVHGGLKGFAIARSALYQVEGLLGPIVEVLVNRTRPRLPIDDPRLFKAARASLFRLLEDDIARIERGVYPPAVLKPENPLLHLLRIPKMIFEGVAIAQRRSKRKAHSFSPAARELLEGLPEYYQRNFHFQGDGYLSEKSAELYEHQVEVLFSGAADAMRRLILEPLRTKFGITQGEGLTFLELGAGTGRATKFVRLAFPKAKIVAVDLSAPYLKQAQKNLREFSRHDYLESDAARLPLADQTVDAVYSVFLFHELPKSERLRVLRESCRVLKAGGFMGFVDSVQKSDVPEFDSALEQFPKSFHEPFYKNYSEHPMRDLLEEVGVHDVKEEIGFFSKVNWGVKGAN